MMVAGRESYMNESLAEAQVRTGKGESSTPFSTNSMAPWSGKMPFVFCPGSQLWKLGWCVELSRGVRPWSFRDRFAGAPRMASHRAAAGGPRVCRCPNNIMPNAFSGFRMPCHLQILYLWLFTTWNLAKFHSLWPVVGSLHCTHKEWTVNIGCRKPGEIKTLHALIDQHAESFFRQAEAPIAKRDELRTLSFWFHRLSWGATSDNKGNNQYESSTLEPRLPVLGYGINMDESSELCAQIWRMHPLKPSRFSHTQVMFSPKMIWSHFCLFGGGPSQMVRTAGGVRRSNLAALCA